MDVQLDTARLAQRLAQFLATTTEDAERIVAGVALQVLADTQAGWPVDSGASRAGWAGPRQMAPLAYQISNSFRYAPIIEYGGCVSPGAKTEYFPGELLDGTIQINPGVYSRQVPAAPLRRALAKSYGEISQRIAESHAQQWGR